MITVLIGTKNVSTEVKINNFQKEYRPFVEEFSNFGKLLQAYKDSKAPIFRDKRLLYYPASLKYAVFLKMLNDIKNIQNNTADILLVIEPKDKYQSIIVDPDTIQIINIKDTVKTDFKDYVYATVPNMSESTYKELISRIGYSLQNFNLYKDKLKAVPILTPRELKSIIEQKHLPYIEEVVFDIIQGSMSGYRNYIHYCNRYTENWTVDKITEVLETAIEFKKSLYETDNESLKPNEQVIEKNDFYKYRNLVMDTKIKDITLLKRLLTSNIKAPVELYLNQTYRDNIYKVKKGEANEQL